jgi:hypothetical protein
MRSVPVLLMLASLGLVGPSILSGGLPGTALVHSAFAQSIEIGGGVRVSGSADARVNVRSTPEVQANNVVAQARGGELLRVDEASQQGAYTWYRVASLADATPVFRGWIRGDLLTAAELPERTLPEVLAETDARAGADEQAATGEASEPTPVPYALRTDWSRDILALYPAIQGCVELGSAPPITVLRATMRRRGLAEVIMSDAAGRRWDCIIRDTGGTPMRYDPLSGSVFLRDRIAKEPFFSTQDERPGLDPDCYRFERVTEPETEAHLGWLIYRTCP